MALPATIAWEVWGTGGNDSNGGGFNTVSAGTDYSQQATAHVTFDGVTIYGTYSTTTTVIIHGYTVAASDIGNVLHITGGTNYTVGYYWITAVNTGTNTWTMDRGCETAGATGMTGFMGGGLLTIAQGVLVFSIAGQQLYVQNNGTYNISASISNPVFSSVPNGLRIIGYSTSHAIIPMGNARPTIATGSNAINGLTLNGTGVYVENLIITNTSGGLIGIDATTTYAQISNVTVSGFATGISVGTTGYVYASEVTGCTTSGITSTGGFIIGCWVHDMACPGISNTTNTGPITYCLITNCTGAASDGIFCSTVGANIIGCTIYGSGRDAIRMTTVDAISVCSIMNNIMANNGGYGLDFTTAAINLTQPTIDYNGYYSNALGNYHNVNAGPHDAAMTASPFNNPSGNDFSLNTASFGGNELRNTGFPGTFPDLATPVGYNDIGVYHHFDNTNPAPSYTLQVLLD